MHRFARNAFRLLTSMAVAVVVSRATAADTGGFAPMAPPASANTAATGDRYPSATQSWPAERVAALSTSGQTPRTLPYAERTASATDNATPRPLDGGARQQDSQQPLPLSPPSEEASTSTWAKGLTPLETGATSLAIVVGLFLLVVWASRRGTPKSTSPLPYEAVEVLGRAPLVGRQHVHLVRCGNKLLLVCILPTGAQTLTEITDPAEVDRLVCVCYGRTASGSPIRNLLERLGGSRRRSGYFDHDRESDVDFAHLDAVHHEDAGV